MVGIACRHGVKTVRESQSAAEAALIWKGRKSAFGATGRIADYICMDGTVPLGKLSYVLEKTAEIVERFGLRVANVFHAGDGNMHPLILFNANDPDDAARAEEAGTEILKLCGRSEARRGGKEWVTTCRYQRAQHKEQKT